MAFKEVQDLDCDTMTALGGLNKKTGKKNPTKVEGFYLGSREVDSPKSKTGKAKIHVFQTSNGKLGVWGKTDLDRKMSQAVPGAMTRVTQSGMQSTKNGDMYKYRVEVDTDNAIEVADYGTGDSEESADTEETQSFDSSEESYDDDAEPGIDEDEAEPDVVPVTRPRAPAVKAAAPDAARQAKVQALLNKGRGKTA